MKKKNRYKVSTDHFKTLRGERKTTLSLTQWLKELIDNARDALAKNIYIDIFNGEGKSRITSSGSVISVFDDGRSLPFLQEQDDYDWHLILNYGSDQGKHIGTSSKAGINGVGYKNATATLGNKFLAAAKGPGQEPRFMFVDHTKFPKRENLSFDSLDANEMANIEDIPTYVLDKVSDFLEKTKNGSGFCTIIFDMGKDADPKSKEKNKFWSNKRVGIDAIVSDLVNGKEGKKQYANECPLNMHYPHLEGFEQVQIHVNGKALPMVSNLGACYFEKDKDNNVVWGGEEKDQSKFDDGYNLNITGEVGSILACMQEPVDSARAAGRQYYTAPGGLIPIRGGTVVAFDCKGDPWRLDTNFSRRFTAMVHVPDVEQFDQCVTIDKNKSMTTQTPIKEQLAEFIAESLDPYWTKITDQYKDSGGTDAKLSDEKEVARWNKDLHNLWWNHGRDESYDQSSTSSSTAPKDTTTTTNSPTKGKRIRGYRIEESSELAPKLPCTFEESVSGVSVLMKVNLNHPATRRVYVGKRRELYIATEFAKYLAAKEPKEAQLERFKVWEEVFHENFLS